MSTKTWDHVSAPEEYLILSAALLLNALRTLLAYFTLETVTFASCQYVDRFLSDAGSARSFYPAPGTWYSTAKPTIVIGVIVAQIAFKATQRLCLHPLATIPGPKIAAFTQLYEFYQDVILNGHYTFVLKSLHDQYGQLIRISPNELHCNDPDFYDEIYTGAGRPMEKLPFVQRAFGEQTSMITAVEHETHRQRRVSLNPLFSKRSVLELDDLITTGVKKLCERIAGFKNSTSAISLKHAYTAFAIDTITEYAFGACTNALNEPDFAEVMLDSFDSSATSLWMNEFFPMIGQVLGSMPLWGWLQQSKDVFAEAAAGSQEDKRRRTIFRELLHSKELPEFYRNPEHFRNTAQNIVGAATSTVAIHLAVTTFHLLDNRRELRILKEELKKAIPDPDLVPPLSELEKLPYLSAVIEEGHRLSHGVIHRLARVSPNAPLQYKDFTIPPGWPVGMTSILIDYNEGLFPSAYSFKPERFLGPEGHQRKKKVPSFGKGTRACLGQNIGTAELHYVLAAVFRKFDLELYETERDDLEAARDYFSPYPKIGAKPLRVLVK